MTHLLLKMRNISWSTINIIKKTGWSTIKFHKISLIIEVSKKETNEQIHSRNTGTEQHSNLE